MNNKLSGGQIAVLVAASLPMAAIGGAGAYATYVNMDNVLHRGASALGLVAAGEGATLIAAIVALAVTLMGQHTPTVVRIGMWMVPLMAAAAGVALAPNRTEMVVMGLTPLAMTAAGEGVTFVARRVVAFRTGVDIEAQRRSGLLVWHANRAANGSKLGKLVSRSAVWRLTKAFAASDRQTGVQIDSVLRYRITEAGDTNLAAVLNRTPGKADKTPESPAVAPAEAAPALPPAPASQAAVAPYGGAQDAETLATWAAGHDGDGEGLPEWMQEALPETEDDEDGEPEDLGSWVDELLSENEARMGEPLVKLMTSDDVAVKLNVKPGTVRTWVHRGKLRVADRDASGRALFDPRDVDQLP